MTERDHCLACGHHRALHAPLGATEQELGAKCAVCQCPGLELAEHDESNETESEAQR